MGGILSLTAPPALDDPFEMRRAGRELLSLALIDARNRLLALLAQAEARAAAEPALVATALRAAAHAGWYPERWISRHVQRGRGEMADPHGPLLAGIEPAVEGWLEPGLPPPEPDALRGYLAETLEITLDLLDRSDDADPALYGFRLALQHEDRLGERLTALLKLGAPAARAEREPLWLPAQRWMLGSAPGSPSPATGLCGFVPHNERWAHEVALPEFEIDAQAVNWRQFAEFAEDGGYDRRECWSEAGWAWLESQSLVSDGSGRRAPRDVEQLTGGVLVMRDGRLQRAPAHQAAMHVTRHEAEAWCRWAGRRLPTEPEWELAASTATSRGFAFGDVFEWTAGSARAWPDAGVPGPGCLDPIPREPARLGVLRGGSFATRPRWKHPKARRFVAPDDDSAFCGFRSCAI